MVKIQLFNPPVFHYQGVNYKMNPSLGLPILSAVLRQAGHECEVVDLEALGVSPQRLGQAWAAQRDKWPDVVGFTALTSQARGARESIAAIRAAGYDRPIVVGGVHATLAPNDVLAWGVEAAVTGECEGNIEGIMRLVRDRTAWEAEAAGYAKWEPQVLEGQPLPIDQIPAPDWSHHSPAPTAYGGNAPHIGQPEGISMWTRGCPHQCIFCGNTVFGHQPIRYRPAQSVAAEMVNLKARHVKAVFVYDDELIGLPAPAGWWQEIADKVGPLGLVWKGQGRCSEKHVTPEVLGQVYRSGGRVLMWGVESFSQKVLDMNKKGTKLADIWTTLRRAKQAGLQNWLFTMVGMYGETDADAALTAAGLQQAYKEGLVDYRQTTVCTALPGTELYRRAVAEGWYTPEPQAGPQMHQVYQSTPWLSAERIAYWHQKYAEVCPVSFEGRAA